MRIEGTENPEPIPVHADLALAGRWTDKQQFETIIMNATPTAGQPPDQSQSVPAGERFTGTSATEIDWRAELLHRPAA